MPTQLRVIPENTYVAEGFPRNPSCVRCSLYSGASHVCVATRRTLSSLEPAPTRPAVVVIGQNPGVNEDRTGYPFVGQSGYVLHEGFIGGGHLDQLASVYVTNAVRCLSPQNSKPPFSICCACFPYTLNDLERISKAHSDAPLCVLCVGAPAASTVLRLLFSYPSDTSQDEAFTLNGRTIHCETLRRPITFFATYHPAYFTRSPNSLLEIHRHIGQLSAYLQGRVPVVTKPFIVPPFNPHTASWPTILSALPALPPPVVHSAPAPSTTPPAETDIPF